MSFELCTLQLCWLHAWATTKASCATCIFSQCIPFGNHLMDIMIMGPSLYGKLNIYGVMKVVSGEIILTKGNLKKSKYVTNPLR